MKLKFVVVIRSQSLLLIFDIEDCSWDFQWSLMLKFKVEVWGWSLIKNLKLKFGRDSEAELWCYLKVVTLVTKLWFVVPLTMFLCRNVKSFEIVNFQRGILQRSVMHLTFKEKWIHCHKKHHQDLMNQIKGPQFVKVWKYRILLWSLREIEWSYVAVKE